MNLEELARVLPKHVSSWTTDDVLLWLDYISLSQLAEPFRSNRIEGWQLLLMTESDLIGVLKIRSRIHRKKVLNWISYLTDNLRTLQNIISNLVWEQLTQGQSEEVDDESGMTFSDFAKQNSKTQESSAITEIRKEILGSTQKFGMDRHMNLYLYQRFNNQNKFYSCNGGKNLTIGKGAENNICIVDPFIELSHCLIAHRMQNHYLRPLSADSSGVWVKISKSLPIDKEYLIEMGFTQFLVNAADKILSLQIVEGHGQVKLNSYTFCCLFQKVVKVGRSVKQNLSFSFDSTMSSLHGKFTYVNGMWYFEDMQTTNGSWFKVKGQEIITDKMTFRVGRTIYIFDCRLQESEDCRSVSSVTSRGVCKICNTAEKNSYFSPCCHSTSCIQCATGSSRCLQCNKSIFQIHRIYRQ